MPISYKLVFFNLKLIFMYLVILNFETSQIDCLDLSNKPDDMDYIEYTESILDYSLSNCEYMVVNEKPNINFLNF